MSAEKAPNGSQPLPVVEVDPGVDPAVANINPVVTGNPDSPAAVEGVSNVVGMPMTEGAPQENHDGYVQQSREAYREAKESGKRFMQHVGRVAVGRLVRRRGSGSTETADTAESTPDDTEQTRVSWADRASYAKDRVQHRLEQRWENRQQARVDARTARQNEREQRRKARDDSKRQEEVDRHLDRLDDLAHKATMTRKEFNEYKYRKQARKDAAREEAMWSDWREQQAAKQRAKQQKVEAKAVSKAHKMNRKFDRQQTKAVSKAETKAHKVNQRYDEGQTRAAALRAESERFAKFRDDPEAYAQYLKEQADQKRERREARVQRVQKIGGKILSGANVATKVALGAAISGGETAAIHTLYGAETLRNDERVQYAKFVAKLGLVAVRSSLGEVLAKASEKVLPTTDELESIVRSGELPLTDDGSVEVSIDLHPDNEQAEAEQKEPVNA